MNNHAAASGSSPRDLALHRRAVEAVIWGMPAVNYQLMYEASARAGGPGDNQIVYWPGLRSGDSYSITRQSGSGLAVNNASGVTQLRWGWGL